MKKVITMILTLAIVISSVAVPTNTVKAEGIGDKETNTMKIDIIGGKEIVPAEATKTPAPTVSPTPAPTATAPSRTYGYIPQGMYFSLGRKRLNGRYYFEGDTVLITKGFSGVARLPYKKSVAWTTDHPEIISVKGIAPDNKKQHMCKITAKKYGKANLYATYTDGYAKGESTVMEIKVVKNEYTCKVKKLGYFETKKIANRKTIGFGRHGVTSAKFNKNGDIVVKCYEKYTKWTKWGRKNQYRSVPSYNNKTTVEIEDDYGRLLVRYKKKIGNGNDKTLSVQHPGRKETVVIPKKCLKGKKIDLRAAQYDYDRFYNVSCSDAPKSKK